MENRRSFGMMILILAAGCLAVMVTDAGQAGLVTSTGRSDPEPRGRSPVARKARGSRQ